MKYVSHENWCNGPGDCSCGQDRKEAGAFAIRRSIDQDDEIDAQAIEITRLKAQVRYWKHKANG